MNTLPKIKNQGQAELEKDEKGRVIGSLLINILAHL